MIRRLSLLPEPSLWHPDRRWTGREKAKHPAGEYFGRRWTFEVEFGQRSSHRRKFSSIVIISQHFILENEKEVRKRNNEKYQTCQIISCLVLLLPKYLLRQILCTILAANRAWHDPPYRKKDSIPPHPNIKRNQFFAGMRSIQKLWKAIFRNGNPTGEAALILQVPKQREIPC